MELRHLRYFVATARAGTVSGAAASLHVTQPGLSRQLRDLERDLGVDLFVRDGGRLRLSRTGQEVLPLATAVLDAAAELRRAADLHATGRIERLLIAAPTVTLTDVVAPFVATMGADDPVVDVRGADGASTRSMLLDGADLAIGADRPGAPFEARRLATLPVWACVAPDHRWAGRASVPLAELVTEVLVVVPPAYTARAALEAAAAGEELSLDGLVEAGNGTIAQALAAAGRGVAVVSDDPRFGLVAVPVTLRDGSRLAVRLSAAWDPRTVTGPAVAAVVQRLAAWVAARYGAA